MSLGNVIFILTFFSQGFIIKKRFKKDALTTHESIFFSFSQRYLRDEKHPLDIYSKTEREVIL